MIPWFFVEVDKVKSVTKTQIIPNNRKINASFNGELNFFTGQKYGSKDKVFVHIVSENDCRILDRRIKRPGMSIGTLRE